MNTVFFKAHPDDEGVDRVEIVAVPRYKTSGLSGDEWRVSASVRLYRKNTLVGERSFSTMKAAVMVLPSVWVTLPEHTNVALWELDEKTCSQFSCNEPATTMYQLKEEFSARGEGPLPNAGSTYRRAFCERHSKRGDCGLEDADRNYTVVAGEGPTEPPAEDKSTSAFGGVLEVDLSQEGGK